MPVTVCVVCWCEACSNVVLVLGIRPLFRLGNNGIIQEAFWLSKNTNPPLPKHTTGVV